MITPIPNGDAEAAFIAFLRSILPSVPAARIGVTLPSDYKAKSGVFVRVERIGGTPARYSHDAARVDIEVWGPSREVSHDTMQTILSHVHVAHSRGGVYAGQVFFQCDVELGPSYRPDDLTNEAKWESTVVLRLRPVRSAP